MRGMKVDINNWIDSKRPGSQQYAHIPMTMGHYTREDLPFTTTLPMGLRSVISTFAVR